MNPPAQTGAPPNATRPKKGNGVTSPSRRGGSGRVLTDVLVEMDLVSRGEVEEAIERANGNGSSAERLLVSDGTLSDAQLARAVAERFGLDHLDLSIYRVDPDAAKLVTPAAVKRYRSVPVSFSGERTLLVAMVDPANVLAVDDIAVMTGYEVRPAVASVAAIERLLERLEDPDFGNGAVAPVDEDEDGDSDVVRNDQPQGPSGPLYDL